MESIPHRHLLSRSGRHRIVRWPSSTANSEDRILDNQMTVRSLLLLVALVPCQLMATGTCVVGSNGVIFVRETRLVPYKRIYLDATWSSDEKRVAGEPGYPIVGVIGSAGKYEAPGVYVAAYNADYFPVRLKPTKERSVFRIDGIMWANPPSIGGVRKKFLDKYNSGDVLYYLSFAKNKKCETDADVSVLIFKGGTHVETTLYHVWDMTNAKDFWPDERSKRKHN